MVSLKSSYIVKPAEPIPNVRLSLAEFDQVQGPTHAPTIYFYPDVPKSVRSAFDTVKNALSQALVQFYPLAGRLELIKGGRFEIHCNNMGVHLLEAESEAKIEDFGDFTPTPEMRKLVPPIDYTRDINELPLLLVQLTSFSCGGISIGMLLSHVVSDGLASLHFISSWAKIARGQNIDILPLHDRTIVYPLASPRFDHVEFNSFPLLIGRDNSEEERRKEITVAMLKLTKDEVVKLKNKGNEGRTDYVSHGYSRYEAIAGHLWRCACKARNHSEDQLTLLRISMDCRRRLHPPLPPGYFGNVVLGCTATTRSGEIMLKPLSYASSKIREAVEKVNDEYIRSIISFLEDQPDLTKFKSPFRSVGCTEGVFRGNPNLVVTSWLGLPIYDSDFGWGKPIHMGPASIAHDGKCFIIPTNNDEDGSLIIAIGLQVAHMSDFKKFFYEDM